MTTAPIHRTAAELEAHLPNVLASPRDEGRIEAVIVRPASDHRRTLTAARLSPEGGIEGDRWLTHSYYRLPDGRSDPCCQLSLMNARFLRQIAGDEESIRLAGDNLIVDLDLSEKNLPAGSQLAIGSEVIIEISEKPHTGCKKFAARYGADARAFANDERGRSLHLRGRFAWTVVGGEIRVGDTIRKHAPPEAKAG